MTRPSLSTIAWATLAGLVLSAMIFALAALVVPPSQAAPTSNCTYYNNAAHATVVGQFGRDCCNNPVAWGVKSAFKTCGGCFICFPPNP